LSFADAARVVVSELAAVSGDLLDAGLDSSVRAERASSDVGAGSLSVTMRDTRDFLAASARAMGARVSTDDPLETDWVFARTPRGAHASTHPADYSRAADGALVPTTWLRPVPRLGADAQALAWMLHAHQDIVVHLGGRTARLAREVASARAARNSGTMFGEEDRHLLSDIHGRLEALLSDVIQSARQVASKLPGRRLPTSKFPSSRTHDSEWRRLKVLHARIASLNVSLPRFVGELLSGPVEIADYPFLYQRWCGLHVLRALAELGGVWRTDITGPLFLGGVVVVSFTHFDVEVWLEPRIGRDEHPSGWRASAGSEAHPDILLTTPGHRGRDAFVLDPTLSRAAAVEKSKYLHVLESSTPEIIAGVHCVRRPRRSWAIVPEHRSACQLDEPFDGSVGVVPLHPLDPERAALRAWIADVVEHGATWAAK
jgi:hypothetical protein